VPITDEMPRVTWRKTAAGLSLHDEHELVDVGDALRSRCGDTWTRLLRDRLDDGRSRGHRPFLRHVVAAVQRLPVARGAGCAGQCDGAPPRRRESWRAAGSIERPGRCGRGVEAELAKEQRELLALSVSTEVRLRRSRRGCRWQGRLDRGLLAPEAGVATVGDAMC